MILRHLEFLTALARERHFARAGTSCHVTQSTLSAGIKQLEESLGVLLVERGQRFMGLTAEGEKVFEWANAHHTSVEEMVKACDVVTINAPLHPGTLDLFNEELIGKMRRGAYLVNTACGLICNREAVVRALESGQLAGYAGDVWYPQPAPKNHPWRTMPHHGMTPHISSTSLSARLVTLQGHARSWNASLKAVLSARNI